MDARARGRVAVVRIGTGVQPRRARALARGVERERGARRDARRRPSQCGHADRRRTAILAGRVRVRIRMHIEHTMWQSPSLLRPANAPLRRMSGGVQLHASGRLRHADWTLRAALRHRSGLLAVRAKSLRPDSPYLRGMHIECAVHVTRFDLQHIDRRVRRMYRQQSMRVAVALLRDVPRRVRRVFERSELRPGRVVRRRALLHEVALPAVSNAISASRRGAQLRART